MIAAVMADRRKRGPGTTWTRTLTTSPTLVETLGLTDVIHIGHSTGGGEVVRYIARHGTDRVAKAVLVDAVVPGLLKTAKNPDGIPVEEFDRLRAGLLADRSQFWKDFAPGFYGANRPGSKVSQGVLDEFWRLSIQCGLKAAHDCIKAFSESDFTEDLKTRRRADAHHPRRRRSDRADQDRRRAFGEDDRRRNVQGLPRRSARFDEHAPEAVEWRPAGVRAATISRARRRAA